jgi:two-component system CheB/CheR fusion protein
VDWQGAKLALTASVGVVALGADGLHARDLLQAAQSACRAAKDAGHDRVRVFEPGDEGVRRRQEQRGALAHLSQALEEGRVALRCQPIVPLAAEAGRLPHLEILLGVKDADGRLVPPTELVAAAEQYEQAVALDRLVIRETLRWMSERGSELGRIGGCAVNLSPQSLADEGLAGFVIDQLMQSRVPPGKLVFEVTETAATAGLSSAQQFMRTLGDLGCRFSLDDFGSGHTSFAYLKGLPVDFVKIDGLFVHGLGENPQDYAVVKSINEIAHVMGKQTIAEHVHSHEVLEQLKSIGVDYAQGYWLGEPRNLDLHGVFDRTVPLPGVGGPRPLPEEMTLRLLG